MKIVRIGNNWYLIVSMLMTMAQFYMATLEEYFVGGLFLPIINGVNEGLWLVIGVLVMTFIFGDDIWVKDTLIGGLPNNLLLFYLLVFAGLFTLFMKYPLFSA